jgi:glycosyltransferase involved in cell wall biosynthesis
MDQQIKISVILSFYNTEIALLKRAIDSVIMQDFKEFELLVVNDGSDINFEPELTTYLTNKDINIKYYSHENLGQSFSINELVPLCKGEYITILDADDEYKPNHLSACLNEMQHADLIASNAEIIVDTPDDYFVIDKYNKEKKIHVDECILFATLFGKKEIFKKYQFKKMYSADSEFFDAVSKEFVVKKVNLRTYKYYRNNPNSICSNYKNEQTKLNSR